MATFNPNVFLSGGLAQQRQAQGIGDALMQFAQMQMKQRKLDEAKAEKQRKEAVMREEDPMEIFAKAQRGEQLTPRQQAIYQFEQAKAQRSAYDPTTGQLMQIGGLPSLGGQQAPVQTRGMQTPAQAPIQSEEQPSMATTPKGRIEEEKLRIKEQFEKRKEERLGKKEKAESQSFADRAFTSLTQDVENISNTIDKAISQTSGWSAGRGSLLSGIPETDAADLQSTLNTIQADAAFGRLQEMREASKTGGALGAVSERELALLSSARTALDQSQSPEQLKENLANYKRIRQQALENTARAYKQDYGSSPKGYSAEAKSDESGVKDGIIIENPQTGERMIMKGGAWQRM